MTNEITHQGVVESMTNSSLSVRIIQSSACAACSVRGHCSSADSKEKIIDVDGTGLSCKVGDEVVVVGRTSMGLKAVCLAFVVPFLVLFISLIICLIVTGGNELLSGVLSLVLLIPYYTVLWLNKNKIKKNFSFTVKPINF